MRCFRFVLAGGRRIALRAECRTSGASVSNRFHTQWSMRKTVQRLHYAVCDEVH